MYNTIAYWLATSWDSTILKSWNNGIFNVSIRLCRPSASRFSVRSQRTSMIVNVWNQHRTRKWKIFCQKVSRFEFRGLWLEVCFQKSGEITYLSMSFEILNKIAFRVSNFALVTLQERGRLLAPAKKFLSKGRIWMLFYFQAIIWNFRRNHWALYYRSNSRTIAQAATSKILNFERCKQRPVYFWTNGNRALSTIAPIPQNRKHLRTSKFSTAISSFWWRSRIIFLLSFGNFYAKFLFLIDFGSCRIEIACYNYFIYTFLIYL